MAKVITRYFESAARARSVRDELIYRRRFSPTILDLYESAEDLDAKLVAAHVEAKTAKGYAKKMAKGGAVLLVRAGYRPLAVAQTTREVTADMGAADMGALVEEVVVKDEPGRKISVLQDHRLFMSRPRDPASTNHYMADWPIPLISRRKPLRETTLTGHGRMANFPIPLISRRQPYSESTIPRHGRMANFLLPLLSSRKPYTESAIPRHGRMANFPIPLTNRRKPFTGSLFPRHQRMGTWPFPLLINGKTGANALIPGSPRMANFPIPLLSRRKPFAESAFGRHARMANFPIPLTSRRKPYTDSAIPRHARMADFILPLTVKRSVKDPQDRDDGRFSFSRMFGLPTLLHR